MEIVIMDHKSCGTYIEIWLHTFTKRKPRLNGYWAFCSFIRLCQHLLLNSISYTNREERQIQILPSSSYELSSQDQKNRFSLAFQLTSCGSYNRIRERTSTSTCSCSNCASVLRRWTQLLKSYLKNRFQRKSQSFFSINSAGKYIVKD